MMAKTAVVIGHGPSLKGKKRQTEMDGFDDIIRLGDFHWQEREDYGSRTDYVMCPTSQLIYIIKLSRWDRRYKKDGLSERYVPLIPAKGLWIASNGGDLGEPLTPERIAYLSHRFRDYNSIIFGELVLYWLARYTTLQPDKLKFSKGILGIIIAAAHLRPDVLYLAGCDDLQRGIATSGTLMGHDIAAESKLVNEISKTEGIKIEYI